MALKCANTSHLPLQYRSRIKARPIPASRFLCVTKISACCLGQSQAAARWLSHTNSLHDSEERRVFLFLQLHVVLVVVVVVVIAVLGESARPRANSDGVVFPRGPDRAPDETPIETGRVVRSGDGSDERVGFGDPAQRDEDISAARRERVSERCGSLGPGEGGDQAGCIAGRGRVSRVAVRSGRKRCSLAPGLNPKRLTKYVEIAPSCRTGTKRRSSS